MMGDGYERKTAGEIPSVTHPLELLVYEGCKEQWYLSIGVDDAAVESFYATADRPCGGKFRREHVEMRLTKDFINNSIDMNKLIGA